VNDDRGAIIEVDEQILSAAADAPHRPTSDAGENIVYTLAPEDSGEITHSQRVDALTNDLVDQRAPDGFDLREFWHTRTVVLR
jgi:hypothetical protein